MYGDQFRLRMEEAASKTWGLLNHWHKDMQKRNTNNMALCPKI